MGIFPFMEFINSRVKLIPFSCFQYTLFMCSCFYTVSSCAYTHITRIHFELTLTKHTSCLILRHKLMHTHIRHTYRNRHTRPNSKYTSKSQSNTNTQQNSPLNPNPKTYVNHQSKPNQKEGAFGHNRNQKKEREGFEWREKQRERVWGQRKKVS